MVMALVQLLMGFPVMILLPVLLMVVIVLMVLTDLSFKSSLRLPRVWRSTNCNNLSKSRSAIFRWKICNSCNSAVAHALQLLLASVLVH